ncbi:protein CEBPZOS isoform 3-T3 [Macrochelys suwanniensis]
MNGGVTVTGPQVMMRKYKLFSVSGSLCLVLPLERAGPRGQGLGMEPVARKIFKGVLLLEMAGVAGACFVFYRMDASQDFRHTMNRRFPSILEGLCI